MKAIIGIRCESGVWADLRIINDGSTPAIVHNPGRYQPSRRWNASLDAYRAAVLRSFHFLEITLRKTDGAEVEARDVDTRADHDIEVPVLLAPTAELVLPIPLHELYVLERGAEYVIDITYGDSGARVSAQAQFHCS